MRPINLNIPLAKATHKQLSEVGMPFARKCCTAAGFPVPTLSTARTITRDMFQKMPTLAKEMFNPADGRLTASCIEMLQKVYGLEKNSTLSDYVAMLGKSII